MTLRVVTAADGVQAAWTGWRIPARQVGEVSDAVRAAAELRALQANLRGEAEQIRAAAHEAGLTSGRAAARAEVETAKVQALAGLTEEIRDLEARTAAQVADLALAIVRRMTGGPLGEAFLVEAAAEAARTLSAEHPLRVRTHPAAAGAIAARLGGILPGVAVMGDPEAPPGACVFEMREGDLDASLPVQLAALDAALARPTTGRAP